MEKTPKPLSTVTYRATEHLATGKTPASLVFQGWQFHTKLPQLKQTYHDQTIQHKDLEYKHSLKRNQAKRIHPQQDVFSPGDLVLKQNDIKKKHDFHYDPKPWVAVSTKDKQVTIAKDNKSLSHHGNKLKLLK